MRVLKGLLAVSSSPSLGLSLCSAIFVRSTGCAVRTHTQAHTRRKIFVPLQVHCGILESSPKLLTKTSLLGALFSELHLSSSS